MRAITVNEPGGPEALLLAEVPDPRPRAREVVIDIVAAGVNRADLLQRQGRYPPPPGAPPYLGLECSGRITELGSEVEAAGAAWKVGDEVCALLAGGGYAQRVAVPVEQLMPIPRGVSIVDAAALPEATCTAWSNLVMTARLSAGEQVLIHGGSSGIGTMAIQVACRVDAVPFVTVGSRPKAKTCNELGAAHVINYREEDFLERVLSLTEGRGVDVVLDIIGAKYLDANLRSLASDGRLVVIGLQGGVKTEIDLGLLLGRRLSVLGTTLRSRSTRDKGTIVKQVVEQLWPAIGSGAVRPVVDRVVPWTQATEAHLAIEQGETVGKVLLQVEEDD